jgi:tetratricopeptide (TPR) repeat protein
MCINSLGVMEEEIFEEDETIEEESSEEVAEEKIIEPGYNGLLKEGQRLYEEKKYRDARDIFRKMLERWPDDPDVVSLYASAHAGLGELKIAHRFAQVAAAMNPEDHNVFVLLAYCSSRFGNYLKALGYSKKAIELCPDDPRGFINKSSALLDLFEFRGARVSAEKALELDLALPHGHLNRGFANIGEGNPGKALEDSRKSFSINFDRKDYPVFYDHALQGVAFLRMKDLEQARTCFGTALEAFDTISVPLRDRDVYKKLMLVHQGLMLVAEEQGEKAERKREGYDDQMLSTFNNYYDFQEEVRRAWKILGRE